MSVLVGSLCLSEEDAMVYQHEYQRLAKLRDAHEAASNKIAAKKVRQCITQLFDRYKVKQVPLELSDWEKEDALSLEARVDRIERHLKLGKHKE